MFNMNEKKKLFIIRKYIFAKNAKEAIRLDKKAPVDDVWIDENYRNQSVTMGFNIKKDDK